MLVDTLFAKPNGYQAMVAVKTNWKAGPSVRYDPHQDEWNVWIFGAYHGEKNAPLRVLVNDVARSGVTDIL